MHELEGNGRKDGQITKPGDIYHDKEIPEASRREAVSPPESSRHLRVLGYWPNYSTVDYVLLKRVGAGSDSRGGATTRPGGYPTWNSSLVWGRE